MSKLLKEALADAKAVRSTAYANAKAAIAESFQPSLQRMISARLSEEEDDEMEAEEPTDTGFGSFEDELGGAEEMEAEEPTDDEMEMEQLMRELDGEEDDEMAMEGDDMDFEDDDMDFEDDEMAMEGDEYEDEMSMENEEPTDDEIYEMIMREMEGEDEEMVESTDGGAYDESVPTRSVNSEVRKLRAENANLKKQKNEALMVVTKLKKTINEVNLLNAKLLYNTKITRQFDLTKPQLTSILESLDRATSIRETKLVYTTVCQTINKNRKKTNIKEGFASKAAPTVKKSLNESVQMVSRWQELANIKKAI
jgi:hypothetical protein